jgi:TonB family protein
LAAFAAGLEFGNVVSSLVVYRDLIFSVGKELVLKLINRYCLLLVTLTAFSSVCFAQDSPKWQRYMAQGEEFSVLLPEEPAVSEITRPTDPLEKPKHGRMYAAYNDGTACVILSLDNPERKEALEVFINEFQKYPVSHAGFEFDREVALKGIKGKQYRIALSNVSGVMQFYLTGRHVYIFGVVSEDLNKPSVKKFLGSITLSGKPGGTEIPGLSQAEDSNKATSGLAPASQGTAPSQNTGEDKVYAPKEVTRKAIVVTRPEPQYTEEARRNQISGTIVLRAVFSASGLVTNIRAVSGLPYDLTASAVGAAKKIKFLPAIKDGKYVRQYIQIEYNFNLY